jgi:hypothetical protein
MKNIFLALSILFLITGCFKEKKDPPFASTLAVTDITKTSALVMAKVEGEDVNERGVVYSKTSNPTTNDTKVQSGNGIGGFDVNITGLTPNTTYHVRVYAMNSEGIGYGDDKEFKTLPNDDDTTDPGDDDTLATVMMNAPTDDDITHNTTIVKAEITDDGGSDVTERGFVWIGEASGGNPTLENAFKVAVGTGEGAFETTIADLASNTGYIARAYAINSTGVSYSNAVMWSTKEEPVEIQDSCQIKTISKISSDTLYSNYITGFNKTFDELNRPTLLTIEYVGGNGFGNTLNVNIVYNGTDRLPSSIIYDFNTYQLVLQEDGSIEWQIIDSAGDEWGLTFNEDSLVTKFSGLGREALFAYNDNKILTAYTTPQNGPMIVSLRENGDLERTGNAVFEYTSEDVKYAYYHPIVPLPPVDASGGGMFVLNDNAIPYLIADIMHWIPRPKHVRTSVLWRDSFGSNVYQKYQNHSIEQISETQDFKITKYDVFDVYRDELVGTQHLTWHCIP